MTVGAAMPELARGERDGRRAERLAGEAVVSGDTPDVVGEASHAGFIRYRADIDGLRAIAVIAVVLFHSGLRQLSGGFVGVDVFFVISGYLITHALLARDNAGGLDILGFYKRRILRLFPALFAVYLFVAAFAFVFLFPSEAEQSARTIVASIFFVSNIAFYNRSGYFDGELDRDPLLHTWSLSVEEQFYIFYPFIIYFTRGLSRGARAAVLGGLAVLSFGAAVYTVGQDAPLAFYFVHLRMWELLVGGLLALGVVRPLERRWQAALLGAVGLGLIAFSMLTYEKSTLFPGATALAPVFGTAFLIHAGATSGNGVARLLSIQPVRFIGLISYSLYLWHWPLIVFYRHFNKSGVFDKIGLFVGCLVIGALSWRFIERPFRERRRSWTPKRTVAAGALAMTAFSGLLLGGAYLNAQARQISPAAAATLAYLEYANSDNMRSGRCFLHSSNDFHAFDRAACLRMAADRPNVLLIGDSHAAHLWHALTATSRANVMQATASGCKPALPLSGEPRCTMVMDYVFDDFLPKHRVDTIVLAARWSAGDIDDVIRAADRLRPYAGRVVVFGPIVEYDVALPRLLAKSIEARDPGLPAHYRVAETKRADAIFAERLAAAGIPYVSTYKAMCKNDCLLWAKPGVPMQFDYGHLTEAGALVVARRLKEAWDS